MKLFSSLTKWFSKEEPATPPQVEQAIARQVGLTQLAANRPSGMIFEIPAGAGRSRMEADLLRQSRRDRADSIGREMLDERHARGREMMDVYLALHGLDPSGRSRSGIIHRVPSAEHLKAMSPAERARFEGTS